MPEFKPARSVRFAEHQLRGAQIDQHRLNAGHDIFGRDGCYGASQLRGQRHRRGNPGMLLVGEMGCTRRFDEDGSPWATKAIGNPLGGAHQGVASRQLADRHDDTVASRPGAAETQRAHVVQHPRIHRLRGAAQRQFTQGRQVRFGEEMAERAGRLGRKIDLASLQPIDELVGRNVDDLDLRHLENTVGHCFANAHAREAGDDVVQALDVLDVDGRVNIDPRRQQFLDVLIPLRVAAAGCIGVGQLVDEREPWPAGEDGVDIHLA